MMNHETVLRIAKELDDENSRNWEEWVLDFAARLEAEWMKDAEPVAPIDYNEELDRYYIPVHPKWEIQTKGKGSSFRIARRDKPG